LHEHEQSSVMLGAGLLAKKAVAKGLKVKEYVKTSLAPGSQVVADYLEKAGVMGDLKKLGFHIVGRPPRACTSVHRNSGPLPDHVAKAVRGELVASAVLSGNRNFEGRQSACEAITWRARRWSWLTRCRFDRRRSGDGTSGHRRATASGGT